MNKFYPNNNSDNPYNDDDSDFNIENILEDFFLNNRVNIGPNAYIKYAGLKTLLIVNNIIVSKFPSTGAAIDYYYSEFCPLS